MMYDYERELRLQAQVARLIYQNYKLLQRAELGDLHNQACLQAINSISLELQHIFHASYKIKLLELMLLELRRQRRDLYAYIETDKMPVQHVMILPFHRYDEDTDFFMEAV